VNEPGPPPPAAVASIGSSKGIDEGCSRGVESGTDGVHRRAAPIHEEDDMSETAGTVLRASRLRMELAGQRQG
jgi:hypothetical protein